MNTTPVTCRKCGKSSETVCVSWPFPQWLPEMSEVERQEEEALAKRFALCDYCRFDVKRNGH